MSQRTGRFNLPDLPDIPGLDEKGHDIESEVVSDEIEDKELAAEEPEFRLWLANGVQVGTTAELLSAVREMDEELVKVHLNAEHNDFADWVREIAKNIPMAENLRRATTKQQVIEALEGKQLTITPVKSLQPVVRKEKRESLTVPRELRKYFMRPPPPYKPDEKGWFARIFGGKFASPREESLPDLAKEAEIPIPEERYRQLDRRVPRSNKARIYPDPNSREIKDRFEGIKEGKYVAEPMASQNLPAPPKFSREIKPAELPARRKKQAKPIAGRTLAGEIRDELEVITKTLEIEAMKPVAAETGKKNAQKLFSRITSLFGAKDKPAQQAPEMEMKAGELPDIKSLEHAEVLLPEPPLFEEQKQAPSFRAGAQRVVEIRDTPAEKIPERQSPVVSGQVPIESIVVNTGIPAPWQKAPRPVTWQPEKAVSANRPEKPMAVQQKKTIDEQIRDAQALLEKGRLEECKQVCDRLEAALKKAKGRQNRIFLYELRALDTELKLASI